MLMPITDQYDPTHLIFSKLIDNLPQAIFWQNNQGLYLGCNNKYVEILGLDDPKKIMGLSELEVQTQYLDSDQIKFMTQHVNCMPLIDEQGMKQGVLGIVELNDFTGSIQTRPNKHQAIYDQLRQILDTIPVAVFWKDKNGYYQGCNRALSKLLQIENEDLCGQRDSDLYWHQHAREWSSDDVYIMSTAATRDREVELTRSDDSSIHIVVSKVALKDHTGEVMGIVGSIQDVSEYRKVESELKETCDQAIAMSDTKNTLFSNIGYDLRAPLHGILALSESLELRTRNKESEHGKLIAGVRQAGKVISYLVEDILSFAKQGTTQIELQAEAFDLRQLTTEVVDMLMPTVNEEKVKIIIDYADTTPRYIINDFHAIRRILSNLISNAIRYTDEGYIIVSVEPIEIKKDWAYLQIVVEDSGKGIDAAILEQLSEQFESTMAAKKASPMGVGLAVVQQLIRELGAKIKINSQVDKGAIFQCSLPCQLQVVEDKLMAQPMRHYLEMSLLMVDDNVIRGNIILDKIAVQEGYLATSQTAYDELLTAYNKQQPYKIVIVDDEIQAQDYVLLAQQIRAQQQFDDIMLVLCSQSVITAERDQELKKAGYSLIVNKPICCSTMIPAIGNAWEQWLDSFMSQSKQLMKRAPHLLLVEDNILAQFATQVLLEDLGCKVEVATNGQQALRKVEQPFDVILMDVGLPDIDGITLTKEIRSQEKQVNQHIPIIALTAHVSSEQKKECYQVGMNHVLTKPTTRDQLKDIICQVLFDQTPRGKSLASSIPSHLDVTTSSAV